MTMIDITETAINLVISDPEYQNNPVGAKLLIEFLGKLKLCFRRASRVDLANGCFDLEPNGHHLAAIIGIAIIDEILNAL